jgi:hypothetical protein
MFPREHWDELRDQMNFLVEPGNEMTPNSEMDAEQVVIIEDFLDEPVSLGTW